MAGEKSDSVWLLVVLLVLVAMIGVVPMLIWWLGGGYMPGMASMMGFGWGLSFTFLIPLVFLVLIALGAYYLITGSVRVARPASSSSDRALEILKERYAKGEITREQYLKMKEELGS